MMSKQPQFRTAFLDGQATEFDLLLAAIPLTLLVGAAIAQLLSVPQFVGVAAGAGLAGSLVGYGIYAVTRLQSPATDSESPLDVHAGRIE